MRFKVIIVLLILIICGCDPLSLQNDLLEYNLEGSVKSIRERAFRAKNENGEIIIGEQYNPIYKGENHNFYMKFNENGFLAKKIAFDENDMEKGTIIYKYDKDDKLIKEESFNQVGELVSTYTYKYENGLLKYKYTTINGLKTSHIAYFYENTVLIEEKHYSKNELSYSTEVDITDRDSIKITEKTSYLSESELTHYRKTITVNGNRTYVESTFSGNQNYSSEIHEYSYDSFGNIIEYIHSSSSTLGSNSSWNLTYEYRDFDEKKNWITKLIYGNGKLYTLAEREIEYY